MCVCVSVCLSSSRHKCYCVQKYLCVCEESLRWHTHTHARTLTLKQPNSEIENKCDKAERWKREGGWKRRRVEEREGGREGNKGESSRCKNSLEGDKKTGTQTEYRKKRNRNRSRNWTETKTDHIPFVLFHASCLSDAWMCVHVGWRWRWRCGGFCAYVCVWYKELAFSPQSLWVDFVALSYSSAFWPD